MFSFTIGINGWLLPVRTVILICRVTFFSALQISWRPLAGGLNVVESITGVTHGDSRDIWSDRVIYIEKSDIGRKFLAFECDND